MKPCLLSRLIVSSSFSFLGLLVFTLLGRNALAAPRDVQFKSIDFVTSVIELHNFGAAAQPFTSWQFCSHNNNQDFRYSGFSALNSISLGAGESLFLHYNNDAPGGATDALNLSSIGPFATPLEQNAYSIGLYVNSGFSVPNSLVDHIQWSIDGVHNTTAAVRSTVAKNALLWTNATDWIATTAVTERIDLILDGSGDPPAGIHGPASYSLTEPTPLSPADFDGDRDVDAGDLGTWTAAYGAGAAGDTDSDGDTDGADFLVVQREFTGPQGISALTAVPEPASLGLVLLAATMLGIVRRSRA